MARSDPPVAALGERKHHGVVRVKLPRRLVAPQPQGGG